MTGPVEVTAQAITLRHYLHVVRRRKWIILQALVLVPAAAVAFSLQQSKRYEASAEVLIGRHNLAAGLAGIPDPLASQSADRVVQTQADLARVPEVARRVLRAVGLPTSEAGAFLAASDVSIKPNADLLVFTVRDSTPSLAARLATEYAREFIRYRRELDTASLERARNEVAARIRELEASGDRRSALYATLVEKEQQLRTLEALQTSNAFLVRRAETAKQVEPRPVRNGLLAGFLGLVLGLGLSFLRDALDTRVRSALEISELLGLPLLGRIPAPPSRFRKKDRLVMLADPSGGHAESFRMLRTNLELFGRGERVRTIMITSSVDGEGKSTTAANLAVAFARAGQRVVLIDLDFRRPYLARFFDVEGRPGITQVALGRASLRDAVTPVVLTSVDSRLPADAYGNGAVHPQRALAVLPTGPIPPDPGEFVASAALGEILKALEERADIVLIDAPPLLHVGDALALAARVDGLVLVTRLNLVRRPMLAEARRLLDAAVAEKLGFVVAGAEAEEGYDYLPQYRDYACVSQQQEPVG